MIEKIKKEILLIHSSCQCNSCKTIDEEIKKQVFKILDKYKDIDKYKECRSNVADVSQLENQELVKYKNAWEELKDLHLKTKGMLAKEEINSTDVIVYSQMLELEQKYNIEVKK